VFPLAELFQAYSLVEWFREYPLARLPVLPEQDSLRELPFLVVGTVLNPAERRVRHSGHLAWYLEFRELFRDQQRPGGASIRARPPGVLLPADLSHRPQVSVRPLHHPEHHHRRHP
jgi:hypothetical protein